MELHSLTNSHDATEISETELDQVSGGTCWYDNKQYSTGAQLKLVDGTTQTCQKDGTWSAS
jgi:bacteriocin-like protein